LSESRAISASRSSFEGFKRKARDRLFERADAKPSLERFGAFDSAEISAESDLFVSGFGSLAGDLEDGLDYTASALRYLVVKDFANKPIGRGVFHFSRSDPTFVEIVYFSASSPNALIAAAQEASFFSSVVSHLSSFISHLSSFIFRPSSFTSHLSSFIFHLSSFIFHPSSFIFVKSWPKGD